MKEEILGLDFDGCLRRWPRFIEWYAGFLTPTDILQRSRLGFIEKIINKVFLDHIPVILDGKLILSASRWGGPIQIITGRSQPNQEQAVLNVRKYLKVSKIHFRKNPLESEEAYKYRTLKREHIDYFIEDREYVVKYLRRHGIKAFKIQEVRN